MQLSKTTRQIGWNDISFITPVDWETTVQNQCHLICERNLQPLFELRWQADCKKQPDYKKECEKIGCTLRIDRIPNGLEPLRKDYQITPYGIKGDKKTAGFFAYSSKCSTLIQVTLNSNKAEEYKLIFSSLSTLQCHRKEQTRTPLSIQDFSLMLPEGKNCMQSYKFLPGLSRIHITSDHHQLHICRLASAEDRLKNQSAEELLKTLCGAEDMVTEGGEGLYYGHRTPSIPQQIVFRMKRKRPFIKAAILHIKEKNRLLILFIESKKPIEQNYFDNIWSSYDLLP